MLVLEYYLRRQCRGYLFDPVLKAINKETQAEHTEPMYCNVLIDRIILSVSESNVPVSVLFLGG